MKQAFVLEHVHELPSGEEDTKLVGIYSSRANALAAVDRLKSQPGFQQHSDVIDPSTSPQTQGFYIGEYVVDQDYWSEGYVTV
jgi:hypothetical protein